MLSLSCALPSTPAHTHRDAEQPKPRPPTSSDYNLRRITTTASSTTVIPSPPHRHHPTAIDRRSCVRPRNHDGSHLGLTVLDGGPPTTCQSLGAFRRCPPPHRPSSSAPQWLLHSCCVPRQSLSLRCHFPNCRCPSLHLACPPTAIAAAHSCPSADVVSVPCFHKLLFPTYDRKEDSLGWLHHCD
jgi:hypothetical protein